MVPGNLALFFFLVVASLCGGFVRLLSAYQSLLQVSGVSTYHPVIQPLVLCIGASLCLAAYILKSDNPKLMSKSKKFKAAYILIPSALTLLRIVSMIIGLRYVSSGVFTSMKSASIIAHVIMEKIFYPMRTYTLNQWTGIVATSLGQGFLAADAFFYPILNNCAQGSDQVEIFYPSQEMQQQVNKPAISTESSGEEGNLSSTSLNIVLAVTLLLISCFPMPFYYILQERFMKAFKLNELQFLGTQSVICVFVCTLLLLVFQWTPCSSNLCIFQDNEEEPSHYFERAQVWWEQLLSNSMFLYTTLSLLIFFPLMTYMDFVIMRKYSGIACNVLSGMYSILPYMYGLAVASWFRLTALTIIGFILTIMGVLVFYHIPNFSKRRLQQQQLGQQQQVEQILQDQQQGNEQGNTQNNEDIGLDQRLDLQEINIDTEILKKHSRKGKRNKNNKREERMKIKQIKKGDGDEDNVDNQMKDIDDNGGGYNHAQNCEENTSGVRRKNDRHYLDLSAESDKKFSKRILRLEKVANSKEDADNKQERYSENDGIEKSIQFSKEELDDDEEEEDDDEDNKNNDTWQQQQRELANGNKQRKETDNNNNNYKISRNQHQHHHRHHHIQLASSTSSKNQPQKFHRPHRTSNIARQHSGSAFLSSTNLSHFFPDKKEQENITEPKNSFYSSAQTSSNQRQLLQNQYQ